jgi:hypothetical protein
MSNNDDISARRMRAAAEEHDQQLQDLLQQTYRQLEHAYHCSPEYGRMVERYPTLARAIDQCRSSDLVGDPARRRPASMLCWQRSHGEP